MRLHYLLAVIALSVSGQTFVRKTVCAVGCDYANTRDGLNSAISDAASYQAGSCVPYLIDIDPTNVVDLAGSGIGLPAKTCAQYVRIRSMQMGSLPADGVRVDTTSTSLARIQSTMPTPFGALFATPDGLKTRYWAFEGIDFYGNSSNGGSNSYSVLVALSDGGGMFPASTDPGLRPDHFELKHCWLHGVPGTLNVRNGLYIGSNNVLLADSVIEDISTNGGEAHAVVVGWTDGPVDLINNVLDSSTENTLVGGTISPAGQLPSFVRFIGNKYTKKGYYKVTSTTGDPAWPCRPGNVHKNTNTGHDWTCSGAAPGTWTDTGGTGVWGSGYSVKNIWEIKLGRGFRVYGNDLSGIWWPSAQNGEVFVMNLVASTTSSNPAWIWPHNPTTESQPWTTITDIYLGANTIHDANTLMTMAYPGGAVGVCALPPNVPPWCLVNAHNNIRVYDNLATNMSDERDYDKGDATGVNGAQSGGWFASANVGDFNLDFRHNTFLLSTTTANSGQFNRMLVPGGDQSGYNNFRDNIVPLGLHGITGPPEGACGWASSITAKGSYDLSGNTFITDGPWGHYEFTTGAIPSSCNASGLFPTGTQAAISGATAVDSAFKAKVAYQNTASDGRDPGADVDHVNWATSGAATGALNTALEYKLRSAVTSITGTQRGVSIYFTAPSVNDCTWELSSDANGYSSSIPVTSQTRSGRDGIAVWSGLSAGQAYFARATCDGLKLEQAVDGRRFMFITAP